MTTTAARPVTVRCPFCEQLNRVDLARLADGPKCAGCGRPLHLDRPVKATSADFDRTIESASVPVLVDFYADWCGPCRMMAPTLDELARRRLGEVLVLKVDTDREQDLAMRFGVRGVPTLVAFREGHEHARHVGMAKLNELEALLGLSDR
jgi:thioredoxin 2